MTNRIFFFIIGNFNNIYLNVGAAYTGEYYYINQAAVRDRNITTNGFSALEFSRKILYALEADTSKKIEKSYRMNKTGVWETPETE